ncbi:MAG: hypothetical protein ACRDDZ_01580 [Marinifilaceae bacterium]
MKNRKSILSSINIKKRKWIYYTLNDNQENTTSLSPSKALSMAQAMSEAKIQYAESLAKIFMPALKLGFANNHCNEDFIECNSKFIVNNETNSSYSIMPNNIICSCGNLSNWPIEGTYICENNTIQLTLLAIRMIDPTNDLVVVFYQPGKQIVIVKRLEWPLPQTSVNIPIPRHFNPTLIEVYTFCIKPDNSDCSDSMYLRLLNKPTKHNI